MRIKAAKALNIVSSNESALLLFDKARSTMYIDTRNKEELSPVMYAFLYCRKHKSTLSEVAQPMRANIKKRYCICQCKYTDGELMLYCDGGCKNWYHPKCVGITEEDAEKMGKNPNEAWVCDKCKALGKRKRKTV